MQAQSKAMQLTWLDSRGVGAGCLWFQGAKKRPAKGQDLNYLVASEVSEVLKNNKRAKTTAKHDSVLEEEPENFDFKA